jgi:hypothetical protein
VIVGTGGAAPEHQQRCEEHRSGYARVLWLGGGIHDFSMRDDAARVVSFESDFRHYHEVTFVMFNRDF